MGCNPVNTGEKHININSFTMASKQHENYVITEADLTPPENLRLHTSFGFYGYNTDIAAHRGLQEGNDCSSGTSYSSASRIALKARVAEFMERYDTWKAQRNQLTGVGMSPQIIYTLPVIKAEYVLDGWLICEFTIDIDSEVTTISQEIFEKLCKVASNKPSIDMFGSTNITLARLHCLEDVAIFKIEVGEDLEPVIGRNALQYFWPCSVESVTRKICKDCNKYIA